MQSDHWSGQFSFYASDSNISPHLCAPSAPTEPVPPMCLRKMQYVSREFVNF